MKRISENLRAIRTREFQWRFPRFRYSKYFYSFIVLSILYLLLQRSFNQVVSDYVQNNYIDILKLKRQSVEKIQKTTGKATEIGVAYYTLASGLSLEDVRISLEEDFSRNQSLFRCKRIDLQPESLLEYNGKFSSITFYDASIRVDLGKDSWENVKKLLAKLEVAKLYFKRLSIEVYQDEKLLLKNNHVLNASIDNQADSVIFTFDDARYYLPVTSTFQGRIALDKREDGKAKIKLKLSSFPLTNFPELNEMLFYANIQSGVGYGEILGEVSPATSSIQGKIVAHQLRGSLFGGSGVQINNFFVNGDFQYKKERSGKEGELSTSSFVQKLYSDTFLIKQSRSIDEKSLRQTSVEWKIKNLQSFVEKLQSAKLDAEIGGRLQGKLKLEETGNRNHWLEVSGSISGKNIKVHHKKDLINGTIDRFEAKFLPDKKFLLTSTGSLFAKPFSGEASGSLDFLQKKRNGSYPIRLQLSMQAQLANLFVSDLSAIAGVLKNNLQQAIKERQTKLLPETYFVTTDLYRDYLRNLDLSIAIALPQLQVNKDTSSIGHYALTVKNKNGTVQAELKAEAENTSENSIALRIDYSRRIPYIDLKVKLKDLPWKQKVFHFCESDIYAARLGASLSFATVGNNLSEFMTHRNLDGEVDLQGIRLTPEKDFSGIFKISDYLAAKQPLTAQASFRIYSHDMYFRSIAVLNETLTLKGYATKKKAGLVYRFYGVRNQRKPVKFSFLNKDNVCSIYE